MKKLTANRNREIIDSINNFYLELNEYLKKWSNSLDGSEILAIVYKYLEPKRIDNDSLFDEAVMLREFVAGKLQKWTENNTKHEGTLPFLLLQFAFAIQGSSADVRRLFSINGVPSMAFGALRKD